jgi:hypothetical protein
VHAQPPRSARLEVGVELGVRAVESRSLAELDDGAGMESVVPMVEAKRGGLRIRVPVDGPTGPVLDQLLHLEQVGEVGVERQAHADPDGFVPVAVDDDVLVEAVGHEPMAMHGDGLGRCRVEVRHREEEGGGRIVGLVRGQPLQGVVVDRQAEEGEVPRVVLEEARDRALLHVATEVGYEKG